MALLKLRTLRFDVRVAGERGRGVQFWDRGTEGFCLLAKTEAGLGPGHPR